MRGVKAYPLDRHVERACFTDDVGGQPIAVFWYAPTGSATAFDPTVAGRSLTFYADAASPGDRSVQRQRDRHAMDDCRTCSGRPTPGTGTDVDYQAFSVAGTPGVANIHRPPCMRCRNEHAASSTRGGVPPVRSRASHSASAVRRQHPGHFSTPGLSGRSACRR